MYKIKRYISIISIGSMALLPQYGYTAIPKKLVQQQFSKKTVAGIIHTKKDGSYCGLKVAGPQDRPLVPSHVEVASMDAASNRINKIDKILFHLPECSSEDVAMIEDTAALVVESPQFALFPVVAAALPAIKWLSLSIGAGCLAGTAVAGTAGTAVAGAGAGAGAGAVVAVGAVGVGAAGAVAVEVGAAGVAAVGVGAGVAAGVAAGVTAGVAAGVTLLACAKGTYYLLTGD